MKTVFAALLHGLGATLASWRVVTLLWVLNLTVAAVLVSPAHQAVERSLAHSHVAADLLTTFDDEALLDFEHGEADALLAAATSVSRATLPWIVLSTMLGAALTWQLARRRDRRPLLHGLAAYGHRSIWLLAMTLGALWGVARLNGWLSGAVTDALVETNADASAGTLNGLWITKLLVMALVAGVVLTAHRVARLRLVQLDERFMPLTWLRGLATTLRHPLVFGLGSLLSWWPLLVVLTLWWALAPRVLLDDSLLPTIHTSWRVLIVFQLTQLLVHACLVYRAAVDVRLWEHVAPPAAPAPIDEPVIVGGAGGMGLDDDPDVDARPTDVPAADAPRGQHRPTRAPASRRPAWQAAGAPDSNGRPTWQPAVAGALVLAGAFVWPLTAPARAQDTGSRAELRNRYVMDVTLDLEDHTATLTSEATFVNTTGAPVDELWMHLYANAFSHDQTVWMRDRSDSPVADRGQQDGGGLAIRSVRLAGGTDLGERTTIQGDPASGPTADASLMHVALPNPVPPGGSVTLELDAVTRFPRTVARMGMNGLHLDGMQWYPKFCAHDDQGWNTQPFWGTGEFFADFGSYDVSFHWPAEINGRAVELEATGVPEELTGAPGLQHRRYTASDVHDFAFCADPAFERFEDTWTAPDGREVQLVYLCQPYAAPKARYVLDVLKSNLRDAADWWMPYPYPRLVVDGLPHSMSGGMEYPMLFTISMRLPTFDWVNDLTEDPAHVTAHEFGHQYYYGLAASNEFEEAWLDEGVNTWATERMLEGHFGASPPPTDALTFLGKQLVRDVLAGESWKGHAFGSAWLDPAWVVGWTRSPFDGSAMTGQPGEPQLLGLRVPNMNSLRETGLAIDRWAWQKPRYQADADARPLATPSREFTRGYGALVYRKTALVLASLERHVGREAMDAIIAEYLAQWAFKHPTGDDFLAVISRATDGAHDPWLRQLVETTVTCDFAVEEVSSRRVEALVGFVPQVHPGDDVVWQGPAEDDGAEPARPFWERWWSSVTSAAFPDSATDDVDPPPAGLAEGDPAPRWRTRYVVRQQGGLRAPVEVEARFADGEVIRQTWDGDTAYAIFEHDTASELVEVVVDPERRFAIEMDVTDNGHATRRATQTVHSLQSWATFVGQSALAAWSAVF